METLTDHIVSGDQAVQLKIEVLDKSGAGGANHYYEITGFDAETNPSVNAPWDRMSILFQNGSPQELGVNGITGEALLAIEIHRLRGFQRGPYPCKENAEALFHCQQALMWLQKRTVERIQRGVEGTLEK